MTVIENPYALSKPLDPMFTVGRHIRVVQAKVEITAERRQKTSSFWLRGCRQRRVFIALCCRKVRLQLPG